VKNRVLLENQGNELNQDTGPEDTPFDACRRNHSKVTGVIRGERARAKFRKKGEEKNIS